MTIDPGVIGAALARHLATPSSCVVGCRVARYRHRPGDRCLVQYIVHVRDRHGRVAEERVIGQWHAESGRAAAIHRRLSKRARAEGQSWQRSFAPVFFDETLGMLATTFPWDRRLPALPRVATGSAEGLVTAMLQSMGAAPDSLERIAVTPVRYREQLNAVCRYAVHVRQEQGAAREKRFFAKVYGDEGGAHAWRLLNSLADATARPGDHARVQAPVTYDTTLRTLVFAEAPGQPLDHLALGDAGAVDGTLARVAVAVARFSACRPQLPERDRELSRVYAFTRSARTIVEGHPSLAQPVRALGEWIHGHLQTCRAGLVHGDLKLEHIFIDNKLVWLIDVDSAHIGDPVWDLALLQARWWSARDAGVDARALGERGWTLLEHVYLSQVPEAWRSRLPALQAAALMDVAAGVIKRCEHDWRARASRIVDRAHAITGMPR